MVNHFFGADGVRKKRRPSHVSLIPMLFVLLKFSTGRKTTMLQELKRSAMGCQSRHLRSVTTIYTCVQFGLYGELHFRRALSTYTVAKITRSGFMKNFSGEGGVSALVVLKKIQLTRDANWSYVRELRMRSGQLAAAYDYRPCPTREAVYVSGRLNLSLVATSALSIISSVG